MMISATGLLSFLSIVWTVTSLCTSHPSIKHPPQNHPDHDVIIVGGSICGLATSVALKTQLSPINVQIYERATSLKPTGALLSLFPNGMTALQNILGSLQTKSDSKGTLCDILNQQSVSSQCTIIKQVQEGKVTDERVVKSVDKSNEGKSPGRFILWYQLQNILLEALDSASLVDENCISLGCEFLSYSFDNSTGLIHATFKSRTDMGDFTFTKTCKLLIGADGIREAKTIAVTATASTEDTEEVVRQWHSTEAISNWRKAFSDFPTDVLDLIDLCPPSSVYTNCVSDLQIDDKHQSPTLCWSNGDEPVVLVGDAVHGMTPSLGQGGNVCMEDAIELAMIMRHTTETADTSIGDLTHAQVMETIRRLQSARNDRVVEIHRSSRNQASIKLSADSSLKNYQEKNKAFFRRLYEWTPTSIC
eukprot:scaffold15000_cov143-Skeletonema_dohrnii-CCMP3373.AAC.4